MIDAAAVSDPEVIPATTAHLSAWHGYCAGCGTWDAHGITCSACGYDFTPDSGDADPIA